MFTTSDLQTYSILGRKHFRDDSDIPVKRSRINQVGDPSRSFSCLAIPADKTSALYAATMEVIRQHSELDSAPSARLRPLPHSVLLKIPGFHALSEDEKLAWQLYNILSNPKSELCGFETWLQQLLENELGNGATISTEDPWSAVFHHVTLGQTLEASEEAQKLGDLSLATLLSICRKEDIRATITRQIHSWEEKGTFEKMSQYQKMTWHAINGQLGYNSQTRVTVTKQLTWLQTFALYVFYGKRVGQPLHRALSIYHEALDPTKPGLHHLHTVRDTAQPPDNCSWYNLLQWWWSDKETLRPRLILQESLPHRLAWLLAIQYPERFENPDRWVKSWCDALFEADLVDWSIYAALYHSNPEKTLKYTLIKCDGKIEPVLQKYHIPVDWLQDAKVLEHARDIIRGYSEEIHCATGTEQLFKLKKNVESALMNLNDITNRYTHHERELASLASQLMSISVEFNDYEFTRALLEKTPRKIISSVKLIKIMSRSFLASFLKDK